MNCRLFGAKPLSEPMLEYCRLDLSEQTSEKFLGLNVLRNWVMHNPVLPKPQVSPQDIHSFTHFLKAKHLSLMFHN